MQGEIHGNGSKTRRSVTNTQGSIPDKIGLGLLAAFDHNLHAMQCNTDDAASSFAPVKSC